MISPTTLCERSRSSPLPPLDCLDCLDCDSCESCSSCSECEDGSTRRRKRRRRLGPHSASRPAPARPTTAEQLLYCHWDDEWSSKKGVTCAGTPFQSQDALDHHLLEQHLFDMFPDLVHLDSNLPQIDCLGDNHVHELPDKPSTCHWDHCDQSVKDILNHIREDHLDWSAYHPHDACKRDPAKTPFPVLPRHVQAAPEPIVTVSAPVSAVPAPAPSELACQMHECNFLAQDYTELRQHLFADHQLHSEAQKNGIGPFQCELRSCGYSTSTYSDLMLHVRVHQQEDNEQPNHNHNHNHSQENPEILTPALTYSPESASGSSSPGDRFDGTCQWLDDKGHTCGLVFSDPSKLSEHVLDCHIGRRKREYSCLWKGCDRNCRPFSQRQKIIRHLQVHTKNKPFRCRLCGHEFAEERILEQHMRVHSGEKPYGCKMCGKRFAANTALSVHMRVHTGEKPLVCKYPGCDKRFSESSNLAKHMKTHYR